MIHAPLSVEDGMVGFSVINLVFGYNLESDCLLAMFREHFEWFGALLAVPLCPIHDGVAPHTKDIMLLGELTKRLSVCFASLLRISNARSAPCNCASWDVHRGLAATSRM